jgi:hypothetical protein
VRDKKFKQILDCGNFAALVNLVEADSVRKRLVFTEGVVRPDTEKKYSSGTNLNRYMPESKMINVPASGFSYGRVI